MAFSIEDLKKRANELSKQAFSFAQTGANTSVKVANKVAAVTRLHGEIVVEEAAIRRAYYDLGKAYFEAFGSKPDEQFSVTCEAIIESQAKIDENKAKIEELMSEPMVAEEVAAEEAVAEAVEAEEEAVAEAAEEVAEEAVAEAVEEVAEEATEEAVVEAAEEVAEEAVAEAVVEAVEEAVEEVKEEAENTAE